MSQSKKSFIIALFLLIPALLPAQNAERIFRTEVTPYAAREDAVARRKANSGHTIRINPEVKNTAIGETTTARVELPIKWHIGDIYLHVENLPNAYLLRVNGKEVARVEDLTGGADFRITRLMHDGDNELSFTFFDAAERALSPNRPTGKPFENCYIYYQDHRAVVDYVAQIRPDSAGRNFGVMELDAVVRNAYSTAEPIRVHFDLYDPAGKLVDHNNITKEIAAGSTDTIHFSTFVYGAFKHQWEARATRPGLYKAMLFVNRAGTYKEYMPFNLGFGKTEFKEGRIVRFGKELQLKEAVLNATDRKSTEEQMKSLKKQGINTLTPSYPQPEWYYDLCDGMGFYVIDQADIRLDEQRTNRMVGGTPSNDPALVDEFVERVKAMYYRSRNHVSVIAYSLGAPSGNGYNMYKAYEWLKSVEKSRPVIYKDADGEWNSDMD